MRELDGEYLHPFLHIEKQEILNWLENRSISYMTDESNDDDTYLRNHIRKNILPEFKTINENYKQSLEQLISYFQDLKDWIDVGFSEVVQSQQFERAYFLSLPKIIQTELIRAIYASTNEGTI